VNELDSLWNVRVLAVMNLRSEAVKNANLVPCFHQRPRRVGTDKACPACNKNPFSSHLALSSYKDD